MKIPKPSVSGAGGDGDSHPILRQLPKPIDSSPLYEPNSVLDPHLTSSPSATAGAALFPSFNPNFSCDPISFPYPLTSSAGDDWPESISWLIADSTSPDFEDPSSLLFPDLSQFEAPPEAAAPISGGVTFDGSHLELLLRAAHAIESGELNSAHSILARLNLALPFPAGNPLQRAAFHFKDALLSLLPIPDRPIPEPNLSAVELVRRIAAHKALSDISPIPQFTAFTANQTLIESLDSSPSIHLIDFDLGLGSQWSSFSQEIAARSRAARLPPPSLRITAVVLDETPETTLAAENLCDFARGIGLRLTVEFVRITSLTGVRLSAGESVAVILTPAMIRLTGASVLRFVRRAAARVVIVIDTECFGDVGGGASFRRRFAGGLEYYAAAMEAVEAGVVAAGAGEEMVRRIERGVFRPRIFGMAAAAGEGEWRDVMVAGGMGKVEISEFTETQGEWLLRRGAVEGFYVGRREGELLVSWKGRELAATSAWRCR